MFSVSCCLYRAVRSPSFGFGRISSSALDLFLYVEGRSNPSGRGCGPPPPTPLPPIWFPACRPLDTQPGQLNPPPCDPEPYIQRLSAPSCSQPPLPRGLSLIAGSSSRQLLLSLAEFRRDTQVDLRGGGGRVWVGFRNGGGLGSGKSPGVC